MNEWMYGKCTRTNAHMYKVSYNDGTCVHVYACVHVYGCIIYAHISALMQNTQYSVSRKNGPNSYLHIATSLPILANKCQWN